MRLRNVSSCSLRSSSCWLASASMRATSSSYRWRTCSCALSRCCASSAVALSCRFFASASAAARRCSICVSLTALSLDNSTSERSASRWRSRLSSPPAGEDEEGCAIVVMLNHSLTFSPNLLQGLGGTVHGGGGVLRVALERFKDAVLERAGGGVVPIRLRLVPAQHQVLQRLAELTSRFVDAHGILSKLRVSRDAVGHARRLSIAGVRLRGRRRVAGFHQVEQVAGG